jgi:integrase
VEKFFGSRIKLAQRIILLGPENKKEGQWKRVPIHRDLVYILQEVLKVRYLGNQEIFFVNGRPPHSDSIRKPWVETVNAISLDPAPVFHDLRHTWKTNARRSGMDPEIREAIMGHGDRTRSVRERYGQISDQELLKAINKLTFDHGKTEIWLSTQKQLFHRLTKKSLPCEKA